MTTNNQQSVTNPEGWVNPDSGTWHYLENCAGGMYMNARMRLQHALANDYDLCGNCGSRYEWLAEE